MRNSKNFIFFLFSFFIINLVILGIPIWAIIYQTNQKKTKNNKTIKTIVSTTTMLNDAIKHIMGYVDDKELPPNETSKYQKIENFEFECLMGVGIDPHNYKTKLSDRNKIKNADLIITNGLHLEAKMGDALSLLTQNNEQTIVKVGDFPSLQDDLIKDDNSHTSDPHIWFDPRIWKKVVEGLKNEIINKFFKDPKMSQKIEQNYGIFTSALEKMEYEINQEMKKFNSQEIILVTAHDAFSYWEKYAQNKEILFKLESIQGISTQTEASSNKIIELSRKLSDKNIKAIFTENSMPKESLISLQEQVNSYNKQKGNYREINIPQDVELYSDSLGKDSDEEKIGDSIYKHSTYIGAFLNNVRVVVKNLL